MLFLPILHTEQKNVVTSVRQITWVNSLSGHVISISKISMQCHNASHEFAEFGMLELRTQVWLALDLDEIMDRIGRDCNATSI